MKIERPSFQKDLWGQYTKLHERLNKKIDYYKSLKKAFDPIFSAFSDLNKKISSFEFGMDPTIPVELYTDSKTSHSNSMEIDSKWYSIPLTMKIVKDFIVNTIDYSSQALFHIVSNIDTLILKMMKEKSEYDDFIKYLNFYSDNKKIMDKNMKFYHQKMYAAEQSVLDLKKLEIKNMSINKHQTILETRELLESKTTQLINEAIKPFNVYKESVDKANYIREESIKKQINLLYTYQNIEDEIGKTNTTISSLIISNLNIQNNFNLDKVREIEKIKNSINTQKDIRQLIINYAGNEKPEEKIPYTYFPSVIDFDKDDTNEHYEIDAKTIEYVKTKIPDEYPNYDKNLEFNKNDMREKLYKLFEEFKEEEKNKISDYIKDNRTHVYFLILLSKLRTNNRFKQDERLINFLGEILNYILDVSYKDKIYDNAKNCIILSQTFYTEKEEGNKIYLLEKIRKHKWLVSNDFWINFIDRMIDQEINKFLINHPEIHKEDILNCSEDLSDKMKFKLSELLFSQLLPYVNNMNEFKLELKNIVYITEEFISKYNFLIEEHKDSIFGLLSNEKEEIEKLRNNYKKENKNKSKNNKKIDNNSNDNKNNNNDKNNNKSTTSTISTPLNNSNNDKPASSLSNLKNIFEKPNNNSTNKNTNNTGNKINSNTNNKIANNNTNKNNSDTNNKSTKNNNNKNNITPNNITNKNDNKNKIESDNNISRSFTMQVTNNSLKNNSKNKVNNPNGTKTNNNEKNQNSNEGGFMNKFKNIGSNVINLSSNVMNLLKKEDKKEVKTEAKKEPPKITQKKEETEKNVKKDFVPVMFKNDNPDSTANNPFGVKLKKVPPKDSNK